MAVEQQSQQNLLVPLETYLKSGLHIGTKYRTKYMEPFVYKIRPDGLAVLNIQTINERLTTLSKYLAGFEPEAILVIGKRENAWRSIRMFSKMTGIKSFPGRYHPGILTNPQLEEFTEAKILLVVDPWPDKDAVKDAVKNGIFVIALCDTNNDTTYVDLAMPCNNKGKKSLGLIFWVLAREYLQRRKIIKDEKEMEFTVEEFMPEI